MQFGHFVQREADVVKLYYGIRWPTVNWLCGDGQLFDLKGKISEIRKKPLGAPDITLEVNYLNLFG